jgi:hypothetical protein
MFDTEEVLSFLLTSKVIAPSESGPILPVLTGNMGTVNFKAVRVMSCSVTLSSFLQLFP